MKTGVAPIKQCLIISLLVIYLFTALAYILFLPRYNSTSVHFPAASTGLYLRKAKETSNSNIQFHRIFKTVITAKNDKFKLMKTITEAFILLFSTLPLFNKGVKQLIYNQFFLYFHRQGYLAICSLRI